MARLPKQMDAETEALTRKVADALKGYRDIETKPDEEVLAAAYWSVARIGTEKDFDDRFGRDRQLARLAKRVAPLRELLEAPHALNRVALGDLTRSGFLIEGERGLADIAAILKCAEIEPPPARGRERIDRERAIARGTASAVHRLTGAWPGGVAKDRPKGGRFAGVLLKVFAAMGCKNASPEAAMRHLSGWRKKQDAIAEESS